MVVYVPAGPSRAGSAMASQQEAAEGPRLGSTDKRWWIAAGAASAVVLAAALYYKRSGRWPGRVRPGCFMMPFPTVPLEAQLRHGGLIAYNQTVQCAQGPRKTFEPRFLVHLVPT